MTENELVECLKRFGPDNPCGVTVVLMQEAADTIASLQAQLDKAREALKLARDDIISLANARWSEVEASDEELVDYIDAALGEQS